MKLKVLSWSYFILAMITDMSVLFFMMNGEHERAMGMMIPASVITALAFAVVWLMDIVNKAPSS